MRTLLILIFTTGFTSCSKQELLFDNFKRDFYQTLVNEGAEKFDYQHWPIENYEYYFKNDDLKFLVLRGSGELDDYETFIIFRKDSIEKCFHRIQRFDSPDRWNLINDSIHHYDFTKKTLSKYVDGKLIKIALAESKEWSWTMDLKRKTEEKYKLKFK